MKTCTKCGETKPLDQYSRKAASKDGLLTACKPCDAEQSRRWREANPERERERKRRYHEANAERVREQKRRHYKANAERECEQRRRRYEANAERERERKRRYYEANREKVAERKRRHYEANAEREREQKRRYYAANAERECEQRRRYYEANPEKVNARNAARRARKLQATPAWLTDEHRAQTVEMYRSARVARRVVGDDVHVDHKVPLKGRGVCGLHVPWNLQLLHWQDNVSKSAALDRETVEAEHMAWLRKRGLA